MSDSVLLTLQKTRGSMAAAWRVTLLDPKYYGNKKEVM